MAVISMLPSGLQDENKIFRSTIIRLKTDEWKSVNSMYKYDIIIDGITLNDKIAIKLYPESSEATEEELYYFNCIDSVTNGNNSIEILSTVLPAINYNIEVYNMIYSDEDIYNLINKLSDIINKASVEDSADSLVLRNNDGQIISTVKKALLADKAIGDEYGRSIFLTYATLKSPSFTGFPLTPYPKNIHDYYTKQVASVQFVLDEIKKAFGDLDCLIFKGTVGVDGTVAELPMNDVKTGHTYIAITEGTYGGYECNIGDLLIARYDSPVQSNSTDDWVRVPGASSITTLRYSKDIDNINITTTKETGDIVLGDAATKIVDETIIDIKSENIPTSKAVVDYIDENFLGVTSKIADNISNTPIELSKISYYPGIISIENITPLTTEYNESINKLQLLSSVSIDDQTILLQCELGALPSIQDKIIRCDNNSLVDMDIESGDWYKEVNTEVLSIDDSVDWTYDENLNIYTCNISIKNVDYIQRENIINYGLSYNNNIYTDETIEGLTILLFDESIMVALRTLSYSTLEEFKNALSITPLTILYEATNKTVEKLSDKVQVKLAKAYTGLPAGKSVIDTNAKANIEVLCPKNKMGSITLRGYNSPQRIMYTLKEKTLYMTTK